MSSSPLPWPHLSVRTFLLRTLPMISLLQHLLRQCLRTPPPSPIPSTWRRSWEPVEAGTVGSWAVFQKLVVRAPCYCLRLNEARGCADEIVKKAGCGASGVSLGPIIIRRMGGTSISSLGGCTFAEMPRGRSTLNACKANPVSKTPRGCLFCQHYEGSSLMHRQIFFFFL